MDTIANVLPIRPQAALPPAPSDEDWAAYIAGWAYLYRMDAQKVHGIMTGLPTECEALVMSELAALAVS